MRIQRKRTKGFRMPDNTVYVGRPSKWGNPFRANQLSNPVSMYRGWLKGTKPGQETLAEARKELRGKNLACWCPIGRPCHADVLLELVNQQDQEIEWQQICSCGHIRADHWWRGWEKGSVECGDSDCECSQFSERESNDDAK